MLKFLEAKWFDIGLVISFVIIKGILLHLNKMSNASLALWMGFAALLLHHAEEYHWPGNFAQWINKFFYKGKLAVDTPGQLHYSFIINVGVEWSSFLLAAFLVDRALWLGMAVMLFCLGNFIKHAIYYPLKSGTGYNPGMISSILFLLPVSLYFFWSVLHDPDTASWNYYIGIPLGIFFSRVSSVQLIEWIRKKKRLLAVDTSQQDISVQKIDV
jgi:hypothetical protein